MRKYGLLHKIAFLVLSFLLVIGLAGCKSVSEKTTGRNSPESEKSTAEGTAGTEEKTTGSETEDDTETMGGRPLTSKELTEFQTFLNDGSNYGFLLSEYDSPEYADLGQVLYNGAGIGGGLQSKEEERAFLAASGSDEIVTDVIKVRASDLDHFLIDRAGIRLTDLKTRFNWTYVPEYDSYYKQHGDTNYAEFLCEEGIEKDGKWQVKCRGQLLSEAEYVSTVTVEKTGDKYRFCANRIDVDGWLIKSNQAPVDSLAGLRTIVADYHKSKGFTDHGFDQPVFDTDTRFYTVEELAVLDPKLYPVFRNEIYARHGYLFKNESWNEFFSVYRWYEGKYPEEKFSTDWFNEFEQANMKLVMELESGIEKKEGETLSADGQEIKGIVEAFAAVFFSGDRESIKNYLTTPFEWDIDVYEGAADMVSDTSVKGLTEIDEKDIGDTCVVSLEYKDSAKSDTFRYLTIKLIKQSDGWKIQFYGIEG